LLKLLTFAISGVSLRENKDMKIMEPEKINTTINPFAFPLEDAHDGMTLLDYFAGCFISSILSHPGLHDSQENISKAAYDLAKAMLKEREKYL
jgi:hypothetical protein